ncbi:MAG: mevalonate kinase [Candidatus Promineifilaceae bacterium]|nr:mevalonate kinase [Candidatus Promineifilaceae bacterium]
MLESEASAPGKIILFGEHAVVYGEPAIAVPVPAVRATARVADSADGSVRLILPDLGYDRRLDEALGRGGEDKSDPFREAVRQVQDAAGLDRLPGLTITLRSAIPIASGLGSGAATAAALVRALARHLGRPDLATDEQVSTLTYEVEKIHHGTPSGIDNTVVAYERPVYFRRGTPENEIEIFPIADPIRLLIADSGVRSSTRVVVGDVRRGWAAEPEQFEALFAACGRIARAGRTALVEGEPERLGQLMNENQSHLRAMGVSSPELDRLVEAALTAGACGAKLSGAGRGGNIIALVPAETEGEAKVRRALLTAGAVRVLASEVR